MANNAQAAPGELETVRAFVNTLDIDDSIEHLNAPDALSAWLREHGLVARRPDVRPADLKRARAVREALRELLLANNGASLDPEAIELLNSAAARAHVRPTFDGPASWRIEPGASGVDEGIGRLLAIVFRAMDDGSWERLKACPEHTCHWAFFDHSKNRSGTWCTMRVCGNRAKARAYRERARAKRSQ